MLKNVLVLGLLAVNMLLISCYRHSLSTIHPEKISSLNKSLFIENKAIVIDFYGDSFFHPLKASQTPYFHKELIKTNQ